MNTTPKAITEAQRLLDIPENRRYFSKMAYDGYLAQGRGAVIYQMRDVSYAWGYKTADQIASYVHRQGIRDAQILPAMDSYDLEREFVIFIILLVDICEEVIAHTMTGILEADRSSEPGAG